MELILTRMVQQTANAVRDQGTQNGPGLNKLSYLIDSDNIHVILVGTGTPVVSERAGPATAIVGAGHFILVDAGPGSVKAIMLMGLPLQRLTAVFITHFHSDHIGDLGELLTMSWVTGRKSKLSIFGPPGIETVTAGFYQAYELDRGYRVAHHFPMLNADYHGFETFVLKKPATADGAVEIDLSSTKATMSPTQQHYLPVKAFGFLVEHGPVKPAMGYRIECGHAVCVVSGDTTKCSSLLKNCVGAQVVVQEALCCQLMQKLAEANTTAGNTLTGKICSDVINYHTGLQECVEIAVACKVPLMLLTHLVPAPNNFAVRSYFLSNMHRPPRFTGRVVLGEDGAIASIDVKTGTPKLLTSARHHTLNLLWILAVIFLICGLLLCLAGAWQQSSDGTRSGCEVAVIGNMTSDLLAIQISAVLMTIGFLGVLVIDRIQIWEL